MLAKFIYFIFFCLRKDDFISLTFSNTMKETCRERGYPESALRRNRSADLDFCIRKFTHQNFLEGNQGCEDLEHTFSEMSPTLLLFPFEVDDFYICLRNP